MGRLHDRGNDGADGGKTIRVQRFAGRSDMFTRLVAMQKALNAKNFAVFRIGGGGMSTKRRFACEMENWGANNSAYSKAFLDAYGDEMLEHIDGSLLPLVWNGRDDDSVADVIDFAPFTMRIKGRPLPFSGIAFPVRLGAIGNGFVVFTADYLDITSDMIIDLHSKSCQVLMDLLSLDERRAIPAEGLSEREIACLQLAGDGRISEEIAEKLGLSVHTVNAYLGSATIKLDSVNRIQAIAKAIRLGYIS